MHFKLPDQAAMTEICIGKNEWDRRMADLYDITGDMASDNRYIIYANIPNFNIHRMEISGLNADLCSKMLKMQVRHINRKQYFEELAATSYKYYIPVIHEYHSLLPESRILEIGCGDGGNLLPFARIRCEVVGIDISESRIKDAGRFFDERQLSGTFVCGDILRCPDLGEPFDVIVCHDVYEHIADKDSLLKTINSYLKPDGVAFVAFPAWQMPFGGHQQICRSRIVSRLPFIHLLPTKAYRRLLMLFGESEDCIGELMSIKRTRTTIEGFEMRLDGAGLVNVHRSLWLVNPHYEIKFGLKPRKLAKIISGLPYLRNWFSTSCEYVLKKEKRLLRISGIGDDIL